MTTRTTSVRPVVMPEGLPTPVLVVDIDVMQRNIDRMADASRSGGFALRPHAKTHKSAAVAARQLAAGAVGLSVATISEAEAFIRAGAEDVFIAYPVWADAAKVERLSRLAEEATLRVGVDSLQGVQHLAAASARGSQPIHVLVEVDSGLRRTGVPPSRAGSVAQSAADAGLEVDGVFTFPGHGYGHHPDARARAARDEEQALQEAADSMRESGVPVQVVSGGSTPTVGHWQPGVVNELRPGVYVFNDATQLAIGSCGPDDLALMAAATVVSVSEPGRFVLDAGSKVIAADTSPWVTGRGYLPAYPDATVSGLWEHHAVVDLPDGEHAPALGSIVAVVPNHVCTAVNLVDELVVVQDGEVVDRWPVTARGANT